MPTTIPRNRALGEEAPMRLDIPFKWILDLAVVNKYIA